MQIDLYFYGTDNAVIDLLEQVRDWHCRRVRIWLDGQTRELWKKVRFRDAQTIDQNITTGSAVNYYEWRIDADVYPAVQISDPGRIALIKRIREKQDVNFAIVSSVPRCKVKMVAFADAQHILDLPDEFTQVPWFNSIEDIKTFCRGKGAFDFDIENSAKFQNTGKTYDGAKIYREVSTGNFVYRDNLHHNHYEVFDGSGTHHLGEMNDDGVLDRAKADPRKHINL